MYLYLLEIFHVSRVASCPLLYVVLILQADYAIYYAIGLDNNLPYVQKRCMSETPEIKKNILVIDSSLLIIVRLISILKMINVVNEIFTAKGFTEAVVVLKEKKTNIVLLDIQLTGKDGLALLKYIVQSYPEIKVIILTNLVSVYYQRLCESLGAVLFIDKSKDFDQIPEIVSAM
jgi:CheY-like chemotaxis protein